MVRGVELHWLSHPDAQVQGNEAKLQTPTQLTSRPPAHEASMYVNTSQTAHSMDAAFSCEKRLCSLMDHMCAVSRHPQALLTTKPFWTDDPKKGYRRLSILRKPPLPSLMKQAGKTLKKIQKKNETITSTQLCAGHVRVKQQWTRPALKLQHLSNTRLDTLRSKHTRFPTQRVSTQWSVVLFIHDTSVLLG